MQSVNVEFGYKMWGLAHKESHGPDSAQYKYVELHYKKFDTNQSNSTPKDSR